MLTEQACALVLCHLLDVWFVCLLVDFSVSDYKYLQKVALHSETGAPKVQKSQFLLELLEVVFLA